MELQLTSIAFEPGGMIPKKYTCDGQNISPPLAWSGKPEQAQSLVLICEDPDAPRGIFTHWLLYNIPAHLDELSEDIAAAERLSWGGVQGQNDFGKTGYAGPCCPPGSAHRYYFRLYALDEKLNLPPQATRQQVLDTIGGHILVQTELMGRYARG